MGTHHPPNGCSSRIPRHGALCFGVSRRRHASQACVRPVAVHSQGRGAMPLPPGSIKSHRSSGHEARELRQRIRGAVPRPPAPIRRTVAMRRYRAAHAAALHSAPAHLCSRKKRPSIPKKSDISLRRWLCAAVLLQRCGVADRAFRARRQAVFEFRLRGSQPLGREQWAARVSLKSENLLAAV